MSLAFLRLATIFVIFGVPSCVSGLLLLRCYLNIVYAAYCGCRGAHVLL